MPDPGRIKCTAITAAGKPCRAWAIDGSLPPRCSAHSGLVGPPKGNRNAVKHGYYAQGIDKEEVIGMFSAAEGVTLIDEAVLLRVLLRRLTRYLLDDDISLKEVASLSPLIVSATRALNAMQKHLPDPNAIDWDAALDRVGQELDWDL